MTSSVSDIKYWKEGSSFGDAMSNMNGDAVFLSYDILMGLSVLGGYFALDHLYLRSPTTFILKLIVNLACFGIWWLYDATHTVFNRDVVKVYGLGIPGMPSSRIASGVLIKENPDSKHLRFFTYAACLVFGGMFGLDSFVTGDNESGIIRLLCLVSVILAPVALVWWGYGLFMFFLNTRYVVDENWGFFGAPASTTARKMSSMFTYFLGPMKDSADSITKMGENTSGFLKNISAIPGHLIGFGTLVANAIYNVKGPIGAIRNSLFPKVVVGGGQSGGAITDTPLMESDSSILSYILVGTILMVFIGGCVVAYRRESENMKNMKGDKDDVPPEPNSVKKDSDK
jgi:hypothetical protein